MPNPKSQEQVGAMNSLLVMGILLAFGTALAGVALLLPAVAADTSASVDSALTYPVPPPPFTRGAFPCSRCHAKMAPNPTRRKLKFAHEEISLKHDEEHRWCLDCHDAANRDQLHLASGDSVSFTESYKLCGQCHGPTLRDWKAGAHGKRTGSWSGKKQYLLCAHCHNPHAPKFQAMKPLPAPHAPKNGR